MRAEFVCDGKPIVNDNGRFEFLIPPKEGDCVVHGECRWKITEIVHDLQRNWLQVVCVDEIPKKETPRRRSRGFLSSSEETPDGT